MDSIGFKDHFVKKILMTASAGLLLACICVALISVLPLYNQLKVQQANNLIYTAKTRSMVVDEFLAKIKETARQITSRSKAREALQRYNNGEINVSELKDFSVPILQDAINLSLFAVGISRLDLHKGLVAHVGLSIPDKFQRPPYISSYKPILSNPIKIENDLYIVVSTPIISRNKELVGFDVVLFTTSKLREIVQDYTGLGKTGETIIGRLKANGQPELFFPTRLLPNKEKDAEASENIALAKQTLGNIARIKSDGIFHLQETQHILAAYGPIKGSNWGIMVKMEKRELFESITSKVFIIGLVVILLVIPLGVLGLFFLLHPLSDRLMGHVDLLQEEITAKEKAIHERILSDAKLLDEKERLNVTLRSIGDGVITTDLDGKILLINTVTERLTGWSQQEVIGRPVHEIFKIISKATYHPPLSRHGKDNVQGNMAALAKHTTLIARDGAQYFIEDCESPIFDKENKMIGTVIVFRDITEKRKIADELLKVKKLESVGVLAGGIAHDFNNILAAILGNIELAEMSLVATNEAFPLLQEAKRASMRAKNLTQQLLTFAKGGEPIKKTTPIGKTITDSANFVLHGSNVLCHFHFPDDLWLVDIDSGQISQVIQNLVINAKQSMPDGGEINIKCANIADIKSETIHNLPGKKYIKITVGDNGCGIGEKHLENIFDPYFTTKQKGSGLGLAITHSIIIKHSGHIGVQSRLGEGTTFTIYLPASDKRTSPEPDRITHEDSKSKAKIMVMDDEQLVQDIAGRMLARLGHEVLLANNGEEAISIYCKHRRNGKPVDIIIMDLTIPGGMGGKDAIKEILRIDPDARAIVSSGYSNDPIIATYEQYGFKAALTKPFLLEDLNKTIIDVLS